MRVVLGLSYQIGLSKTQFYSFSWASMETKYQVGDLILLRKEPHLGTTYPIELKEAAEKNEPVAISKVGGFYGVKIGDITYTVFNDEIVGFYSTTTLFL